MTKKTLSTRVSQEVYDTLAERAEARGVKISEVARDILEENVTGKGPLSADEAATFLRLSYKVLSALKMTDKNELLLRLGKSVIKSISRDESGNILRSSENNSLGFVKIKETWDLSEEYLRRFDDEQQG